MTSATFKKQTTSHQRAVNKEIRRLREEVEDLSDTLDLLEARVRNFGKPTYSIEELRKKLGLK